jgi:predicted CXXCH cytochrome family protein
MMKINKAIIILLSAVIVLAALAGNAMAKEADACLKCHGKKGRTVQFQDGTAIEAYVDAGAFKTSVHRFLDCPECHQGFSTSDHPNIKFRSKELFKLRYSRICRRCHKDKDIRKNEIHASLLQKEKNGDAPVCTDCHTTHSVMPVNGGRVYANESKYCMGCHAQEIIMHFKNGESLSLTVDTETLHESAHSNLSCSDCHFGFSSEEHPRRNFRTNRDYAIASADVCRRCHFDKYTKTLESIHYSVLSQGNLTAPTCTDCHGSHGITRITADRAMSARKCRKCHSGIYDIYSQSVHGDALINEHNQDVPTCTNCHKAHEIGDPLAMEYHEKIPEMCSNCHSNKAIVGKYGLSTDVVKTYLSDFHGITLEFYKTQKDSLKPTRPIAVCTDCHGTHNIMGTVGPAAAMVKDTLLKRCRKCHEGATENFPDTWLSHYVPSMSKAPMIFIVNSAYKILMPAMVIGLMLQVLLHVWRYIVNR